MFSFFLSAIFVKLTVSLRASKGPGLNHDPVAGSAVKLSSVCVEKHKLVPNKRKASMTGLCRPGSGPVIQRGSEETGVEQNTMSPWLFGFPLTSSALRCGDDLESRPQCEHKARPGLDKQTVLIKY